MSLKGQYVRDGYGVSGMIESEEPDEDNMVIVYYGTLDKKPERKARNVDTLEPIDTPLYGRVNGEIPAADLAPPPSLTPEPKEPAA